ncbi:MAG: hypothetical protein RL095_3217 [Verrucomicrobiota bacterium]
MNLPVKQNLLDWLTQLFHICLGRRVRTGQDEWLRGPIGRPGEDIEQFIERIAAKEGLRRREAAHGGLLPDLSFWPGRLKPAIADFYCRTSDFKIDIHTDWRPPFGIFGSLISRFYGRRVQQLCLPADSDARGLALSSRVIDLVDAEDRVVYTLWHRWIEDSGENVFWGLYGGCCNPAGEPCVKAVFPLPQGSLTALFKVEVDQEGHLDLISRGTAAGGVGCHVFIEDGNGQLWCNSVTSFHQNLRFTEQEGLLQAVHRLSIWGMPVATMIFAISAKTSSRVPAS